MIKKIKNIRIGFGETFKNINFSPEDIRITLVVAKSGGVATTKC
jgi:hypothetical protein